MSRLVLLFVFIADMLAAQQRPASPVVYEQSYSFSKIPESLRELVNQSDKAAYFNDTFFNSMLKEVLEDKQYGPKERIQIFYLMLQKIGYAFAGVAYLPPTQNYFKHHLGIVYVLEKTQKSLASVSSPVSEILDVMRAEHGKDDMLAANALLLATLMKADSALPYIEKYARAGKIAASKLPAIFNHYVCLAASLAQSEQVVTALSQLVTDLKKEAMIEDVLCAIYSRPNPVGLIQKYILSEDDPENELAIQTALNALAFKVPEASYKHSIKAMQALVKVKWKQDLLGQMYEEKISFDYGLASSGNLVTKVWDGFTVSHYLNGNLISVGEFLEFDPN